MDTLIKSEVGNFKLDCTTAEQHTSKMRITENPVESGANVADHAILEPKELVLTGVVVSYEPPSLTYSNLASNSFLGYSPPIAVQAVTAEAERIVNAASSALDAIQEYQEMADFSPSFNFSFNDSSSGRVQNAVERLLAIQKCAEVVTVQTQTRNYSNMLITSIAANQSKPNSIEITINLKEIFIVETQTASGISVDTTRDTTTQNLGKTQPKAQDQSVLKMGAKSFGYI